MYSLEKMAHVVASNVTFAVCDMRRAALSDKVRRRHERKTAGLRFVPPRWSSSVAPLSIAANDICLLGGKLCGLWTERIRRVVVEFMRAATMRYRQVCVAYRRPNKTSRGDRASFSQQVVYSQTSE